MAYVRPEYQERIMRITRAVSYTHLDVYKRQVLEEVIQCMDNALIDKIIHCLHKLLTPAGERAFPGGGSDGCRNGPILFPRRPGPWWRG